MWEAVGARARYGVDVHQRGGARSSARREELDWLLGRRSHASLRERTPQLVTLVGVPGIGKSRLVWELARAVDADPDLIVFWRQGRSLPYGEGVAFWAVAEMVKAQAGILETDSAEAAETKLHRDLADLIPDAESARWIETQLRPLVGLAGEEDPSGDRRDEAFAAWRRFFEALAERRPLVLVFEDLHWADDNLLDFVDYLVDWASGLASPRHRHRAAGAARATAGLGRREVERDHVSLPPLSEDETARLLASLLDQTVMPAETPGAASRPRGGQPALRGGVRAHGLRARSRAQ